MTSPNYIAASSWGKTRYRRLKSTVVRWAIFTSNTRTLGYCQTSSAGTRTDSLLRRSYDEGRAFTEIGTVDVFVQNNHSLSGEVGTVRGRAD